MTYRLDHETYTFLRPYFLEEITLTSTDRPRLITHLIKQGLRPQWEQLANAYIRAGIRLLYCHCKTQKKSGQQTQIQVHTKLSELANNLQIASRHDLLKGIDKRSLGQKLRHQWICFRLELLTPTGDRDTTWIRDFQRYLLNGPLKNKLLLTPKEYKTHRSTFLKERLKL